MQTIYLTPYKQYSNSCKELQQHLQLLGYKVFRTQKEITNPNALIINWGNQHYLDTDLNPGWYVYNAIDKRLTFMILKTYEIPSIEYTTIKENALKWYESGKLVVARHIFNGSKGKGITLHSNENSDLNPFFSPLPDVPLYTLYKKKSKEFRVYVFKDEVIDVLEKRKRKNFLGEINTYIRSYKNGWVFCRNNIEEPDDLRELAINTIKALNLDFGGVDIIWNKKENKCYVLEVNTAPGITNTSCKSFAFAIDKYIKSFGDNNNA